MLKSNTENNNNLIKLSVFFDKLSAFWLWELKRKIEEIEQETWERYFINKEIATESLIKFALLWSQEIIVSELLKILKKYIVILKAHNEHNDNSTNFLQLKIFEELENYLIEIKNKSSKSIESITVKDLVEKKEKLKLWKFNFLEKIELTRLWNAFVVWWRTWVWKTAFAMNFIDDLILNEENISILYFWTQEIDEVKFMERFLIYKWWRKYKFKLNKLENLIEYKKIINTLIYNSSRLQKLKEIYINNFINQVANSLNVSNIENLYISLHRTLNEYITSFIEFYNIKTNEVNKERLKSILESYKNQIYQYYFTFLNKVEKIYNVFFIFESLFELLWITNWLDWLKTILSNYHNKFREISKDFDKFKKEDLLLKEVNEKIKLLLEDSENKEIIKEKILENSFLKDIEQIKNILLEYKNNLESYFKNKDKNELESIIVKMKNLFTKLLEELNAKIEEEQKEIDEILNEIKEYLLINDVKIYSNLNVKFIKQMVRKKYYECKTDNKKLVVIIDYLNEIDYWKSMTEYEKSWSNWKLLLELTRKYNVFVLWLIQTNKIKNELESERSDLRWWEWVKFNIDWYWVIEDRSYWYHLTENWLSKHELNFPIYEFWIKKNRHWPLSKKYYIFDKNMINYIPINNEIEVEILDKDKKKEIKFKKQLEEAFENQLEKSIKEKQNEELNELII